MSVEIESEPRAVPERSFDLLDTIAARVQPDDPGLAEWFSGYWRRHRSRLAVDLQIIEDQVAPAAKILDCGAVPPIISVALSKLGFDVSAVDIAPERFATSFASFGLDPVRCDIESQPLPFDAETFDAVVFNELFEHLRINPITTLREVWRVLEPGGVLLLSTPNLRSFRGIRNLLVHHHGSAASTGVYRQYEKLDLLGHMGHVREYTVREVSDFLTRVGFRIEKIIYRGGHGRGLVGLAERLAPTMRPFFSLVAVRAGNRD